MAPPNPNREPGPIDQACDSVLLLQDGIRDHLARMITVTRELTALRLSFPRAIATPTLNRSRGYRQSSAWAHADHA